MNTRFLPKILCYSIVFLLIFSACNPLDKRISEGVIHYKISYPTLDSNNVLTKFLPRKMTLSFKNGQYKEELTAGIGLFRTGFLHDAEKNKITGFLKVINVKHMADFNEEQAIHFNRFNPKIEIRETEGVKEIFDMKCKKVRISYLDDKYNDYDLFYTDDIKLDNPNFGSQFQEIPGVMLNFELERYGLLMSFKAIDFVQMEIEEELHTELADYELVSAEELEKKIQEAFLSFKL